MANRTSGRSTGKGRTTLARGKRQSKGTAKIIERELEPQNNKEIVQQKLEDLTSPIMERYGTPAFDEIMARLEITVREFNDEVGTLFKEMVDRSHEDHERMKSLLSGEETDDEKQENEHENGTNMSEYERRLEEEERKKTSVTEHKKKK